MTTAHLPWCFLSGVKPVAKFGENFPRGSDERAPKGDGEARERWERCAPSRVSSSGPAMHLRPPPAHTDQKKAPVVEEFRRLSFKGVANELEKPAGYE